MRTDPPWLSIGDGEGQMSHQAKLCRGKRARIIRIKRHRTSRQFRLPKVAPRLSLLSDRDRQQVELTGRLPVARLGPQGEERPYGPAFRRLRMRALIQEVKQGRVRVPESELLRQMRSRPTDANRITEEIAKIAGRLLAELDRTSGIGVPTAREDAPRNASSTTQD